MELGNLAKTDLNLLISLQVLLEEKSVSRAASRLFITQPAMSKTLGRLRETFNDPLFTRGSRGIQPTPKALALAGDLQTVLQDIQRLVAGPDFDPAKWVGEMTLVLSEYIGISLIPPLMARLHLLAPGMTIRSVTRVENQLQQLADGELDIAVLLKPARHSDDFIWRSLGGNPPVILARKAHPLTGLRASWEDLRRYPMVRLYIADRDEMEFFHNPQSLGRRLATEVNPHGGLETSHLLTALEVLRNTDYIMPAPPFLLDTPTVTYQIQALPTPESMDYNIEYMAVRHCRTANSPPHNWLWEQIFDICSSLTFRAS